MPRGSRRRPGRPATSSGDARGAAPKLLPLLSDRLLEATALVAFGLPHPIASGRAVGSTWRPSDSGIRRLRTNSTTRSGVTLREIR